MMAKQNKPLEEQAIPWEPIPREANWYTLADVVYFEQQAREEGIPVSVVLASSLEDQAARADQFAAWRIIFRTVVAFRMLPTSERMMSLPSSARPPFDHKSNRGWENALWEIVHSRWLAQFNTKGYKKAVHHFVIASWYVIYEVLAVQWECEQLSGGWRERLQQRQQMSF
jgi:hypothetical protein